MKARIKHLIVFLHTIALLLALTGCALGSREDGSAEESRYFIKGADISSLEAVEDYGGTFYGFDGEEVDVITFLMENGCNYFRLRIWNNPTMSFEAGDYCNLEHTVEMAKRIKEAGGQYLLDFHYSDWWADPNSQTVPAEWAGLDAEGLADAVYEYTAEVLNTLADEDAYPDMVQIGNEIGNGMLWDYGSFDHPETLAAFLNSGISAVRDTTPDGADVQIMIHVESGGSVGATETFFETIESYGVTDYDLVGLSYYPYWQGTFADMKENIDNIYERFGKQVVLAETAYPFTTDSADDKSQLVSDAECASVGFEASEENQKLVLELIMNSVATCEGGLGIFYWEPAWIAVDGVGVSKDSGNEWENQALFDFEGKALAAVQSFAFEPGSLDSDTALYVYPFDLIEIDSAASGDALYAELPQTADILYSDGSIRQVAVDWDLSTENYITATHVTYKGTVLDFSVSVGAELIDKSSLNNLDFEDGDTGWEITDEKGAGQICKDGSSYPHSGEWSFQYWNEDSFEIDLYQQVKITETEQYNLSLWSQGVGDTDLSLTLYIADADGNILVSEDFTNDGWAAWQHPLVSAELNEGDLVRIGVQVHGGRDDWGTLDEFSFYSGEPEEDSEEESTEIAVVSAAENLLQNSSFENGENGWSIERVGTGGGTVRNDKEGNPYTGDYSFHYWNDTEFTITVSQTLSVSKEGSYALSVFSQGDADTDTYMTLFLSDADGNILSSVDFSNTGWNLWQHPVLEGIALSEGQEITVGVVIHGAPDGWGTLDDFALALEP